MTQRDGFGRLDSQEARRAFRSRYDECIFRAAYSLTGSYHQAQQLKRALFAQVEDAFCDKPLPGSTELFLLSQLNLLYARGAWRQAPGVTPIGDVSVSDEPQAWQPAEAPAGSGVSLADAVAQPESGAVTLGEVVYIPRRRAQRSVFAAPEAMPEEEPAAPVMRTQAVPVPERATQEQETAGERKPEKRRPEEPAAPAQPPAEQRKEAHEAHAPAKETGRESRAEESTAKGAQVSSYDPELTAEWSPNMDEDQPPLPEPEDPRKQEAAPQQDEDEEEPEKRRSIPLTMLNCVLVLALIAAGIYLVLSMGLL